ncbi:MAG: TIGR00266 family protein [Armatimonadota bacterium]
MEYEIRGTVLPTLEVELNAGETIYTESGGMAWMTEGIKMDTNMKGGVLGGLKRMVSGESLFLVDYTATTPSAYITFTSEFPGNIIANPLKEGEEIILQRDAFMCAESSVTLDMHFHKRLGAGLFGGEGFFLQRVTGPGIAFAELAGEITEYSLEAGQTLKLDPGHLAMMDPTVDFNISMVKGIRNVFFGGEGLFLATVRGPGRVWLQSMPIPNLVRRMIPYLPKAKN